MIQNNDVTDILKEKHRMLVAAWMLPNEGVLTDSQRQQAMNNFTSYLRRNDLTATDVSRQLGSLKATKIAALMKDVSPREADDDIRMLNLWVEQHARAKATRLGDRFVATKVAKAMATVARLVQENQTMALALGPTGIGKTRCALAVHETYVGSIYRRIMHGYHHAKGLTRALSESLGVVDTGSLTDHHFRTQLERVMDRLHESGRLVILDEAHKLSDAAIELSRDLHDVTGVPILLVATKDLHDRILRTIGPDHGQTYSRIDIVHHLTQGHDIHAGGRSLFTLEEIRRLYQEPPIRLSSDAARYLQGVANQLGYGSLRRCKILLKNAVRRARKRMGLDDDVAVTVTAEDLEWVETRLRQETGEQLAIIERRKRTTLSDQK